MISDFRIDDVVELPDNLVIQKVSYDYSTHTAKIEYTGTGPDRHYKVGELIGRMVFNDGSVTIRLNKLKSLEDTAILIDGTTVWLPKKFLTCSVRDTGSGHFLDFSYLSTVEKREYKVMRLKEPSNWSTKLESIIFKCPPNGWLVILEPV